MSNGPIQIETYPHKTLLKQSNDIYSIPSLSESPSETSNSQSIFSKINQKHRKDSLKRKHPSDEESSSSCYNSTHYLPQDIESADKTKRPRIFSTNVESKLLNHSLTTSIHNEHILENGISYPQIKPEISNLSNTPFDSFSTLQKKNIICESSSFITDQENFVHPSINQLDDQHQCQDHHSINEFPFPLLEQLISERAKLILDQLKHSDSLDDANKIIQKHLKEFLLSYPRDTFKFAVQEKEKNLTSIPKFKEIIDENNQNIHRCKTLESQLENEQLSNKIKDQQLDELKSELSKKNIILSQVQDWFESYYRSQNLMARKSCGFNERLPPDVY